MDGSSVANRVKTDFWAETEGLGDAISSLPTALIPRLGSHSCSLLSPHVAYSQGPDVVSMDWDRHKIQ